MGSDAELFVFDHRLYRRVVVPALFGLLAGGEVAPWLEKMFRSPEVARRFVFASEWPRLRAHLRREPVDLTQHCTWLGADLGYRGTPPADLLPRHRVTCASRECPVRSWCPLHESADGDIAELINSLHQAVVELRCLGPSQFLGRSATPDLYDPVLHRRHLADDHPVRGLLTALTRRGAALGFQYEATSGIYGWLTPGKPRIWPPTWPPWTCRSTSPPSPPWPPTCRSGEPPTTRRTPGRRSACRSSAPWPPWPPPRATPSSGAATSPG